MRTNIRVTNIHEDQYPGGRLYATRGCARARSARARRHGAPPRVVCRILSEPSVRRTDGRVTNIRVTNIRMLVTRMLVARATRTAIMSESPISESPISAYGERGCDAGRPGPGRTDGMNVESPISESPRYAHGKSGCDDGRPRTSV